ncbi:MAG: U32 family peptidase [bacterium]
MIDSNHKIKIMVPIDRIEEAEPLIKAGADEFFCGVLINNQDLSCPRRGNSQICNLSGFKELERLTALLKKNKKSIFVAFNHLGRGINYLNLFNELLIDRIKNIGVDGVIVSSLDLLNHLRGSGLKLVASSILGVKNYQSADFLIKEFGVKRIIFDRQVTLDDIKDIVSRFPQIEFEAFGMESGCRSLANVCLGRFIVVKKDCRGQHLCFFSYTIKGRGKLNLKDEKIIADRMKMPFRCCGACALFYFKKYGISSVKIVGRGFLTKRKIENIRLIKKSLDILQKNYSQEIFYQKVENLFNENFNQKCNRKHCYYPHFFRRDN